MPELAYDEIAMKKRFNELVWECSPRTLPAGSAEEIALGMLRVWEAAMLEHRRWLAQIEKALAQDALAKERPTDASE